MTNQVKYDDREIVGRCHKCKTNLPLVYVSVKNPPVLVVIGTKCKNHPDESDVLFPSDAKSEYVDDFTGLLAILTREQDKFGK